MMVFNPQSNNIKVSLAEWEPKIDEGYERNIIALPVESKMLIDSVMNGLESQEFASVQIMNSYRAYLEQCFFDCMHIIINFNDGVWIFDECINESFDKTIMYSNPAFYTHQLLSFICTKTNLDAFLQADIKEPWDMLNKLMDDAVKAGAIYSLAKYFNISHVIADIAFDAGYSDAYESVQQIKAQMGLSSSGKRNVSLREVAIAFARNLFNRGFREAARQLLLIGFPDISIAINKLKEVDMNDLLSKMDPHQAVQVLLSEKMSASLNKGSSAYIVESVFRIIG